MTGIEEVAVLVGLGLLAKGCNSSKEETLEPTPTPDGMSSEPENDMGTGASSDAPSVPVDVYHAPDSSPSPDAAPDAGPHPVLRPDVNISPSSGMSIFATDFVAPSSLLTSLDLTTGATPTTPPGIASTDVVLRSSPENIYAIDRTNSTIHVYDNALNPVRDISAGESSNPQDYFVLPDRSKGYISRLDSQRDSSNSDDLWIVDPDNGDLLSSIDLKPYTTDDGERLARAAQMVYKEDTGELYVMLQDLSRALQADTNGKVVVVDTDTDEVTDTIQLDGRNPADITYSEILNKIFVTDTGPYPIDLTNAYGGIEVINPDTNATEGIRVDDQDLGGAVSEIRLASADLGYVITD